MAEESNSIVALTAEQKASGWIYGYGGVVNGKFQVIRYIDWNDAAAEPCWAALKEGVVLEQFGSFDEALAFAEATLRLEGNGNGD